MSDFGRRFDPSELGDREAAGVGEATATELLDVTRDLDAFARSESITLSVDFEDRVMAAIALEPPPRAAGGVGLGGLVAAIRDSWRLTWSGGRPLAVRAQALALVVLAAFALGSLGAVAAVGVGRLLAPEQPTVTPAPLPTPQPSILPSPSPETSPSPSPSPSPTSTASPTVEATETAEPTQAARPTSDSSGSGSGSGGDSSGPGSGSSDDSSGPGSGSGETAKPTETPGDDSSGHGSGEDVPGSG